MTFSHNLFIMLKIGNFECLLDTHDVINEKSHDATKCLVIAIIQQYHQEQTAASYTTHSSYYKYFLVFLKMIML